MCILVCPQVKYLVRLYVFILCYVTTLCSLCVAAMIVYKTWLSVVCSLLRPSRAVAICTFALLGSVGNWALAVLTGNDSYGQLWDVTEEYVGCVLMVPVLYRIPQNFQGRKLSRFCSEYLIRYGTFVVQDHFLNSL